MKILVIGCGSTGKRHIRNLIKLKINVKNIHAIDKRKDRIKEVKNLGIEQTYNNLNTALKNNKYYAGIVCSPTSFHMKQCISLAKNKINLFIEKPLSSNLTGIKTLQNLIKKNNLKVLIAYVFRFEPSITFIKSLLKKKKIGKILYFRGEFSEYLPDFHPYENYRNFYMANKSDGGGSILDQSHIMDLAHYLLGKFKKVLAFNSKISSLDIKADDIAELIIKMENNVIASIHTDIFGREHKKKLEIKGKEGNITWDFYKKEVKLFHSKTKKVKLIKNFRKDFNDNYIEEMRHFLNCCFKNNSKTRATLQDGIDTMKLILASEKSNKLSKEVKIS